MKEEKRDKKELVRKVVSSMIDSETWEWPPKCVTFLYQPIRPQRKMLSESEKSTCQGLLQDGER